MTEQVTDHVLFEKDVERKVATITLNRPDKMNALTMEDAARINSLVQAVNADDEVKVLIFKGSGENFCSGQDVKSLVDMYSSKMGERRPSQRHKLMVDFEHLFGRRGVFTSIATCWKATIAQVQGYCWGTGLYIAMATDMVIAAENTTFTHPGWQYLGPISAWQLIINVGVKKAKEMMLTGRPITAQEAYEYGMVNYVVSKDKLEPEANRYADMIACYPIDGLVMGKAQFEIALDAMGMYQGYGSMAIAHTLQTNIRYEPGEFNLMKEMHNKGVKGALQARKGYFKA